MIKFNKIYFVLTLLLFLIEILIATYATGFMRHTIGDYLCVILIYTFIKSFAKVSNNKTAFFVLVIAYSIEFIQLTDLQKLYPSEYSKTLKLILGTSFSFGDLVAYTLGIITALVIEVLVSDRTKT
jgi:hypothetical protein